MGSLGTKYPLNFGKIIYSFTFFYSVTFSTLLFSLLRKTNKMNKALRGKDKTGVKYDSGGLNQQNSWRGRSPSPEMNNLTLHFLRQTFSKGHKHSSQPFLPFSPCSFAWGTLSEVYSVYIVNNNQEKSAANFRLGNQTFQEEG